MARSSSRTTARKPHRKPFTREQLLPLPAAKVRALSLEHHLALAALRGGHGGIEQIGVLLKVVYLLSFMAQAAREPMDSAIVRDAEALLHGCGVRGQSEGTWALSADDHAVIAQVLALHDDQLRSLPAHRYDDACARVHAFLTNDELPPLSRRSTP